MELSQLTRLEQFYQMKEFIKNIFSGGVKKGALTEQEAEKKFQDWLTEKKAKTDAKKSNLQKKKTLKKLKH